MTKCTNCHTDKMTTNKKSKTILIDLDGVLNEYKGNFDPNFIPKIKNGAKKFLKILAGKYNIKLFTTRNRLLASKWVIDNKLDCIISDITNVKEPCYIYIDDRCINFDGSFENLIDKIENFKPYYK